VRINVGGRAQICVAGVVRSALALNSGGRRMMMSFHAKWLGRLGDGVAIGLIKLIDEDQLTNPDNVQACLTLIGTAFHSPEFVTAEEDKKPKVTLFLLNYLHDKVSDSQLQGEIQQTIEYVRQQTLPSTNNPTS
jgi:hypothetical protein